MTLFELSARNARRQAKDYLIYLHALRRSRRRIRKMNIHDLIYFDRQNEGIVIQTGKKRRLVFTASIVLGTAGTFLLMVWNIFLAIAGGGCVILALFGFFLSFASGVPAFFDRKPAWKYRGQNLLIFRTLTAKLDTMGMLMAVISIVFTATLISEGTGLVFRGIFEGRAAEDVCFDLYLGVGDGRDPAPYVDYICQNISVEQALEYRVCESGGTQFMDYLEGYCYYYGYDEDPVLRYSDYAALRAIAGYRTVELEPGQYLIHCMPYLEGWLKDYDQPFNLGDTALALTMTAATILTIQQLSESGHYRRQFELLRKLGMGRREMSKALGRQFAIYYAMPAVPPVLIGVPFILNLARAPEPGVMVGANSPAAIVITALMLFFLIYAVYILLAYTSLKRNVLPESR